MYKTLLSDRQTRLRYVLFIVSLLMFNLSAATNSASPKDRLSLTIYNFNPKQISGLDKLRQQHSVGTIELIDLSIIPEIEARLNRLLDSQLASQNNLSDEELLHLKLHSHSLIRSQIKDLAEAQLLLFDLEAQYGISDKQLPVIIFQQKEHFYLHHGADAHKGFLAWLQFKQQAD